MNVEKIKVAIIKNDFLYFFIKPIYNLFYRLKNIKKDKNRYEAYKKMIMAIPKTGRIWYFGCPEHFNLGDQAQYFAIKEWIRSFYNEKYLVEITTNSIVNTSKSIMDMIVLNFDYQNDIIIFQSGYCTTDLGGYADEMHRMVIEKLSDAKMIMMPQTVFFKKKQNEQETSKVYNLAKNMLFLARDQISYNKAKDMFPDVKIKLFPDAVTSWIGCFQRNKERKGILLCIRNDLEKFYTDKEIGILRKKLDSIDDTKITDTTKREIDLSPYEAIQKEINDYANYKIVITDRYHGTIFSLIAGTPVIVIKTNDHKVITGADWFTNVYKDYVYKAEKLDSVVDVVKQVYSKKINYQLDPYFKETYWNNLKQIFEDEYK